MKRIRNIRPGRLVGQLRQDIPEGGEAKGLNRMVVFEPGKNLDVEDDVFTRLMEGQVFRQWFKDGWLLLLAPEGDGPVDDSGGADPNPAGPELKDIANSKLTKVLDAAGFNVVRVAESKVEDLTALPGIGEHTAIALVEAAKGALA